jgi:hypothetical protein
VEPLEEEQDEQDAIDWKEWNAEYRRINEINERDADLRRVAEWKESREKEQALEEYRAETEKRRVRGERIKRIAKGLALSLVSYLLGECLMEPTQHPQLRVLFASVTMLFFWVGLVWAFDDRSPEQRLQDQIDFDNSYAGRK